MPLSGDDEVAAFRWVLDTEIGEAGCVTFVADADVASVARCFGERGGDATTMTLRDVDSRPDEDLVAVRSLGTWVLAVEINGWQGSRAEVLTRISQSTRAVSAFWNVNALTRFSYAVEGRVLTAFEAMSPESRQGAEPDALEATRAGLPWDDFVPAMLALVSRVTGEPLTRDMLAGEFQVFPIEPWAEEIRPDVNPEYEGLTYDDPPLAWALRRADARRLSTVSWSAARRAVTEAGLASDPAVATLFPAGGVRPGESRPAFEALDHLAATLEKAAGRSAHGDRTVAGRFWAVTALREALNPVPLAAAFRAIPAALSSVELLTGNTDDLRQTLFSGLGDPRPPSGSLGLAATPGKTPVDRYQWIRAHWLAAAGWLLFTQGTDSEDVARVLGSSLDGARTGIPTLTREPAAAIRTADGWDLTIQWRHAALAKLPHLPHKASAVSVTWSGNGRGWLHIVADGQIMAGLDPQRPRQKAGSRPSLLDPYLDGLRMPVRGENAAGHLPVLLVIAERITGIPFTPESLDLPHTLISLPARP
ncbi:MAG: DUF6461 domain-containing protein [Trebonia sp.]